MNISDILSYRGRDKKEDYYAILGCHRTSTKEQILAEYKVRAKQLHPDKRVAGLREDLLDAEQEEANEVTEEFQLLQEVKRHSWKLPLIEASKSLMKCVKQNIGCGFQ